MKHRNIIYLLLALVLAGCSSRPQDTFQGMFPDYTDITIPCNIAPLNFRIANASAIKVQVKGVNGQPERTIGTHSHGRLHRTQLTNT